MDPLSISAAIVGLLTAATAVTALLRNVHQVSKSAREVALEVTNIAACLTQLQSFLYGSAIASRSRTSLIMIDQILVVLTGCVATFSEFQETLNHLNLDKPRKAVDKLRWAMSEKTISRFLLRLQRCQTSLNLMLSTLTCSSLEEARSSSEDLRQLVQRILVHDPQLAERIEQLDTRTVRPSNGSTGASTVRIDAESFTTQSTTTAAQSRLSISQSFATKFSFENDLLKSRVYGRVAHRYSQRSLPSSTGRSCGWSYYSSINLSEISDISVVSLPVSVQEIYNPNQYTDSNNWVIENLNLGPEAVMRSSSNKFEGQDFSPPGILARRGELLRGPVAPKNSILVEVSFQIESIDATDAALWWPTGEIADWMFTKSSHQLQLPVISQFLTEDISGFSILFTRYEDLVEIGIARADQRENLWSAIKELQGQIFEETLYRQGMELQLSEVPAMTLSDRSDPDSSLDYTTSSDTDSNSVCSLDMTSIDEQGRVSSLITEDRNWPLGTSPAERSILHSDVSPNDSRQPTSTLEPWGNLESPFEVAKILPILPLGNRKTIHIAKKPQPSIEKQAAETPTSENLVAEALPMLSPGKRKTIYITRTPQRSVEYQAPETSTSDILASRRTLVSA